MLGMFLSIRWLEGLVRPLKVKTMGVDDDDDAINLSSYPSVHLSVQAYLAVQGSIFTATVRSTSFSIIPVWPSPQHQLRTLPHSRLGNCRNS